jgi:NAD(P)-dependent dehydrogenase (short-subunit alcohol dehydrogenase family)
VQLNLDGRRALVTGGTRGIGRAIAESLAAEGCRLALCARDEQEVQAAADAIGARGSVVDVRVAGAVAAWVGEAARALGGVDLLVANVGGADGGGTLRDSSREEWVSSYDLNVGSAIEALRACVEPMGRQGAGSAVFISSVSGSRPQPRSQYGTAKAGLDYAAAALARELGPSGIRVNAVAPGSIMFPGGGWDQVRQAQPERFAEFERSEFPLGRLGSAEEVARVVTFVLSDAGSWINGTTITVDGAQNAPSISGY